MGLRYVVLAVEAFTYRREGRATANFATSRECDTASPDDLPVILSNLET